MTDPCNCLLDLLWWPAPFLVIYIVAVMVWMVMSNARTYITKTMWAWCALGVFCLLGALFIPKSADSETILTSLFQNNQIALLAMVIALAAYTSSVSQKLRETIAEAKKSNLPPNYPANYAVHVQNLLGAQQADITLALTGITLIFRIAAWSFGYRYECIDIIIIGLLAWIILYFVVLHGIQLCAKSN